MCENSVLNVQVTFAFTFCLSFLVFQFHNNVKFDYYGASQGKLFPGSAWPLYHTGNLWQAQPCTSKSTAASALRPCLPGLLSDS